MLSFIFCITILYILSFFSKENSTFKKEKTLPLKGIMAIFIVLHHLSFTVNTEWIQIFHSWGAPIVSIFFFISGYGLMISYLRKNQTYISTFFKRRMWNSLFLPYCITLTLYIIICTEKIEAVVPLIQLFIRKGETILPHSWFVFTISVLYLCFYVTSKVKAEKTMLSVLFLMCIGYILLVKGLNFPRCWYISVLAFPFGAVYARYEDKFHLYWSNAWRYYSTVPLCLCLMSAGYLLKCEWAYMAVYVLIPLIVVCICSRVGVEKLNRIHIIAFISALSYEYYLCQGIAMNFIRGKYVQVTSDAVYVVGALVFTLFIAYGVKQIKEHIIKRISLCS